MVRLFTEESHIDRETILDVLVNVIPVGILLLFFLYTLLYNPWGYDGPNVVIQHFLTLFPLVLLFILTYVSARVISRDEAGHEAGEEPPEEAK